MPQRKLASVPTMLSLALAGVSWAMSTDAGRASEKCITAPNAPARNDEHWYYRTDRATNRQCWYLAPHDATVGTRASQEPKQSSSKVRLPPDPPLRTQPEEKAFEGASDAKEAGINVAAPWPVTPWPEPAKWPDTSPAPERTTPRLPDPIDPAPTPASYHIEESHAAAPAQAPDRPSSVLVAALGLVALSGPAYHAVRWLRRRRARDRWNVEPSHQSPLSPSHTRSETAFSADSTEQLAETLQKILNEMQTELYGSSDTIRPFTERELYRDQRSAPDRVRAMGQFASGR